jgi:aspartate aminotransferase-like enzyme
MPPEGVNAEELNKAMKGEKYTPGSGYGKLKPTNIRIGHMGDVDVLSVKNLLAAYERATEKLRATAPAAAGA